MKEQEKFIKNLSALLEEKGITQRELAEKIEVTEVTISRYLSGERSPRIEIVSKIAEYFKVTVDYLLGIERDYGVGNAPEGHQEKEIAKHNEKLQEKEIQVAFSSGFAGLNEENKKLAMEIIAGLKAKQDLEDK